VYTASRILFGMALEGRVPRVLARCNARGVPVYCVCVTMLFSVLAFLQLGNGSAVVLQWCAVLWPSSEWNPDFNWQDYALRNRLCDGKLRHDLIHLYPVPRRTFEPSGCIFIQLTRCSLGT
jgi:hypothetical protein